VHWDNLADDLKEEIEAVFHVERADGRVRVTS
jgi:hypothetical protein